MLKQSKIKKNDAKIKFEHIELDKDFPITLPCYGIRGYKCSWIPHIHDCLEIGYCRSGEGFFQVGSKFMPFKGGDAIIINNHEFHWARAKKNKTAHWGFMSLNPNLLLRDAVSPFSPILQMSLYTGNSFHNVIDGDKEHELAEAIGDIFREQDKNGLAHKDMIRALVTRMLVLLYRNYGEQQKNNPVVENGSEIKLVPALNYINKNISTLNKFTDLKNNSHWGYYDILESANTHIGITNGDSETWVK